MFIALKSAEVRASESSFSPCSQTGITIKQLSPRDAPNSASGKFFAIVEYVRQEEFATLTVYRYFADSKLVAKAPPAAWAIRLASTNSKRENKPRRSLAIRWRSSNRPEP